MNAYIMAGGLGTRIAAEMPGIPKPMIPLLGKPLLEHQIECLVRNGIVNITIITGYLGKQIIDYFSSGERFGCSINYFEETDPLGTAGALFQLELPENFLLINGDILFDLDFSRFIAAHDKTNALVTIAVHPNSHPYDSSLIAVAKDNQITQWLNKEDPRLFYKNLVNAGIHILSKKLFFNKATGDKTIQIDLDRDILKPQIQAGGIYAYPTPEYIKDIGTPDRLREAIVDLQNGIVTKRNLLEKQRAVFLDRDGSINKLNGFITKPEDLELLEGAAEAIKEINRIGVLVIVVTNQPIIARGEATLETLEMIHNKMETDLGKIGAYVDDIFFCPHHPDKGFPGEVPEYKIDCECRKPKPGMLLQAAATYNIDLSASYMIGDSWRDIVAGQAAGCQTALISNDAVESIMEQNNFKELFGNGLLPVYKSLNEFVQSQLI